MANKLPMVLATDGGLQQLQSGDLIPPTAFRNACIVQKSVSQTAADFTSGQILTWDSETYDDGGWHDNVTNNGRMTVPSGVTRVRITSSIRVASITAANGVVFRIAKNGTFLTGWVGYTAQEAIVQTGNTSVNISLSSGPIPCVAGDYFEAHVLVTGGDTSVDINSDRSYFAIEAA